MITFKRDNNITAVGLGEVLFDRDAQSKCELFGGAPANFAYHFLRIGEIIFDGLKPQAYIVSAIGQDQRGAQILEEIQSRGLSADSLQSINNQPTGLVDKQKDEQGINRYTIHPAAWDQMLWNDNLASLAARTNVVCFGSLAQRDLPDQNTTSRQTIQRFVEAVRNNGHQSCRVFDVNIRQHYYTKEVLERSIELCNILKISDEELPMVAQCLDLQNSEDLASFCTSLLHRHPHLDLLILTQGGDGSQIFSPTAHHIYTIPTHQQIRPLDTVGAGDSFTAALCASYLAGFSISRAQAIASRLAAFVCMQPSATPLYPADARQLFGIDKQE